MSAIPAANFVISLEPDTHPQRPLDEEAKKAEHNANWGMQYPKKRDLTKPVHQLKPPDDEDDLPLKDDDEEGEIVSPLPIRDDEHGKELPPSMKSSRISVIPL